MTKVVFAANEFATSYDVTYDVAETGVTTVTEKVTLRNLTSQYYATEFKLTIGATEISDVKSSDSSGPMEVQTQQDNTATLITVKFNQQVAGLDKTFPWTLQFQSKDFAVKHGKVWEVTVPKVSSSTALEAYALTLSVPANFGEPVLISPIPKKQTLSGGKRFLTFDKDQLIHSGISATFGTDQIYDFDLSYHLENTKLVPILTNIALPPDTAYQDVIYQRIDPKPLNVTVDDDGNYLAWYRLDRNQQISVNVVGSAKLYSTSKVKNPQLSDTLHKRYTENSKYWEKDTPAIKLKVSEILGANPPEDNTEKVRLIYRYVVNYLKYDSSRLAGNNIDRFGAVAALNNPTAAVCMEFTDLFVALVRAAGIPARELDGYAYTANSSLRPLSLNKDILHAWPEYWDSKKGWIMVDPTWESTTGGVDYFNKFDLNHFVFVIKGSSSEQPVPAGSYKLAEQDTHDVKVNLSEIDFLGKPLVSITIENPEPIQAGLPGKLKVKVLNKGNALQQSVPLTIQSNQLQILDGGTRNLGPIPAFGSAEFELNIRTKSFFESYDDVVSVIVGREILTKDIQIRPVFIFNLFPYIFIAVVLGILAVYGTILSIFIYRRRMKRQKADKESGVLAKEKISKK